MPEPKKVEFDKPKTKAQKRRESGRARKTPRQPPLKERIPVLKPMEVDPETIRDPDQRAVACANMRLAGAPFHEIAKELGYANATTARSAYISALANMNPTEDLETLRQSEASRAELLFRRSLAMATADFLVVREVDEETGEEREYRVPNTEKLRWHEQAAKDLMLHATITGAKAPARMEVSATVQELNQMVHVLVEENDRQIAVEPDVWEMDAIEALSDQIEDEDD